MLGYYPMKVLPQRRPLHLLIQHFCLRLKMNVRSVQEQCMLRIIIRRLLKQT
ncbi:polyadenylate-binding protein-interacting protein 11 [Phtheirospermum japonicum]|uniref:Polyadenylate-binding protein-interacting protein 11 n=1 Tax=Phtheirospermum japonicum TaxID=374723 RepID=A0A830D5K3_9LAMI|nr:polyadenylate-binding protein-interacting protein 11 [Phtheirospermum japonicum]